VKAADGIELSQGNNFNVLLNVFPTITVEVGPRIGNIVSGQKREIQTTIPNPGAVEL
jgi:hypothetical protein